MLSSLGCYEGVEIGISEHLARAFLAVADADVAERAGGDVAVEGLDRAAELSRRLNIRAQAIGRADAGLPLPPGLFWREVPFSGVSPPRVPLDLVGEGEKRIARAPGALGAAVGCAMGWLDHARRPPFGVLILAPVALGPLGDRSAHHAANRRQEKGRPEGGP